MFLIIESYSYGLEETNQREKAEQLARRALDLDRVTPFAYHAMCKRFGFVNTLNYCMEVFSCSNNILCSLSFFGYLSLLTFCLFLSLSPPFPPPPPPPPSSCNFSWTLLLAHVMEEEKKACEGVEFLTTSRDCWKSSVYEGHLTWHLSLYYLGKAAWNMTMVGGEGGGGGR